MKHDPHTPYVMNNTDSFFVKICGCGVIHLSFGAMTLNVTEQTLIAITETLKDLTHELWLRKKVAEYEATEKRLAEGLTPADDNVISGRFPRPVVAGVTVSEEKASEERKE